MANDGTVDDTKQLSGVMINADGDWVIAEPDQASWDQYQARAKVSAAAQEAAARGNKMLQEKGLECSIDKRLFVEPSKTPCCQKTYCLECITNALLENDLRCPQCNTENILLDDLKPDEQMLERVRDYEQELQSSRSSKAVRSLGKDTDDEKAGIKKEGREEVKATANATVTANSPYGKPKAATTEASNGTTSALTVSVENASKKRPADSELANTRTPTPPGAKATKPGARISSSIASPSSSPVGNPGLSQTTGPLGMPALNSFMNMQMGMMPPMAMGLGAFNPMDMMNPIMSGNNNWNGMWSNNFAQQPFGMPGGAFLNGMSNDAFGGQNIQLPMNHNYAGSNGMNTNGSGRGTFANQQRNHFAGQKANEEDSPYFRKPVNPHRHQTRRNVSRPADYREI